MQGILQTSQKKNKQNNNIKKDTTKKEKKYYYYYYSQGPHFNIKKDLLTHYANISQFKSF